MFFKCSHTNNISAKITIISCSAPLILQNLHKILFHAKVDFAVAVEGAGTFGVSGEGGDQVGVFDLPIDVAGEGSAGKVAAGNFVQRVLDLLACDRGQFRYQAGDAGHFEGGLDVVIVVLLADEGQQVVAVQAVIHYLSL